MSGLITRYERNTAGRDLIVGDIHGHFSRLQRALDAIGFDPAKDRLFSVGDLVDRGPESHDVLTWLEKPWFIPVQGNHEDMAIRWGMPDCRMDAGNYVANGGAWNVGNTPEERATYSHALRFLPVAIEIETEGGIVGIVHADCPTESWEKFRGLLTAPDLPRSELKALRQTAMWDRSRIEAEYRGGVPDIRAVVVGHTPLARVVVLGNVYHIDTAGWHPSGAGFTFLDAATLTTATVPSQTLREAA